MIHPTDFDPPMPSTEADLMGLIASMVERWRWLAGATVLGIALSAIAVAWTRGYSATAMFVVERQSGNLSQFSGLANQLGFDVPSGLEGDPLGLFEALLHSDDLLLELSEATYSIVPREGEDPVQGSASSLLGLNGKTEAARRREIVDHFRDHVSARVLFEANAVEVSATTPWPELSEAIVEKALSLVNAFNLERRRRTSGAERAFVEANVAEAESRLLKAEAELEAFLDTNRRYQQSPQLMFRFSRLQRAVDRQQLLVTSLLQALEQARIAEVRNTPVISVVDRPAGSARPSASIGLAAAAGGGLALALALLACAVADYVGRQRRFGSPSLERLRAATGRVKTPRRPVDSTTRAEAAPRVP
ncbi:MAG: Wzz/FepE/Etk N-terminal domain-containing protein [Gemmatimonadota bacterium]|nr:Wzz/FepE/Etk N-terminal domain-containing protein [Gemmatimonadota bacterium]